LTRSLYCLLVVASASAFVPPQPLAQHSPATAKVTATATATVTTAYQYQYASSSPLFALQQKDTGVVTAEASSKANNLLVTIWNRMDTLQASGINKEFAEYPPLVSRGGGFKRFMVIMAVGMAYKWYRARFINKVRVQLCFCTLFSVL
jgi:hypothetical protein